MAGSSRAVAGRDSLAAGCSGVGTGMLSSAPQRTHGQAHGAAASGSAQENEGGRGEGIVGRPPLRTEQLLERVDQLRGEAAVEHDDALGIELRHLRRCQHGCAQARALQRQAQSLGNHLEPIASHEDRCDAESSVPSSEAPAGVSAGVLASPFSGTAQTENEGE